MAKSKNRDRSPQQGQSENGDREERERGGSAEEERRRPQASPADMARKQQKRFGHN
jgi:hypothetical protein